MSYSFDEIESPYTKRYDNSKKIINRYGYQKSKLFLFLPLVDVILGADFFMISPIVAGFIQSPQYPNPYPAGLECIWSLTASPNFTVIAKIYDFDVKPRVEGICSDYLRFSAGVEPLSQNVSIYCGQTYPNSIHFNTRNLYVEFSTPIAVNVSGYHGFRLGYSLYIQSRLVNFSYIESSSPFRTLSLNNANVPASRRYPIQITCGYTGMPVLTGTNFTWFNNNQQLGTISANSSTITSVGGFTLNLNSDNVSTTLTIFKETSLNVYSNYRCNITTVAQTISIQGNLIKISDYQLQVLGENSILEGQTMQLECTVIYTLGNASGWETFTWLLDNSPLTNQEANIQIISNATISTLILVNITQSTFNTSKPVFTCSYDGDNGIKSQNHTVEILQAPAAPKTLDLLETLLPFQTVIPSGVVETSNGPWQTLILIQSSASSKMADTLVSEAPLASPTIVPVQSIDQSQISKSLVVPIRPIIPSEVEPEFPIRPIIPSEIEPEFPFPTIIRSETAPPSQASVPVIPASRNPSQTPVLSESTKPSEVLSETLTPFPTISPSQVILPSETKLSIESISITTAPSEPLVPPGTFVPSQALLSSQTPFLSEILLPSITLSRSENSVFSETLIPSQTVSSPEGLVSSKNLFPSETIILSSAFALSQSSVLSASSAKSRTTALSQSSTSTQSLVSSLSSTSSRSSISSTITTSSRYSNTLQSILPSEGSVASQLLVSSNAVDQLQTLSQTPVVFPSPIPSQVPVTSQAAPPSPTSVLSLLTIPSQVPATSPAAPSSQTPTVSISLTPSQIPITPPVPSPSLAPAPSSNRTCPSELANGYLWPETSIGMVALVSCQQSTIGNASRACIFVEAENRSRWDQVSTNQCPSQSFISLQQEASLLNDSSNNITDILSKLQNITETPANKSLSVGDILVANSILDTVANVSKNQTVSVRDLYEFVRTGSNLIDLKNRNQWNIIQQTRPGTTELSRNLDQFSSQVSVNPNQTIIVAANNIVMEVYGFSPQLNRNYQFPDRVFSLANSPSNDIIFQTNNSQNWLRGNKIKLPASTFQSYNTNIKVVSFMYRTLSELLPDEIDQSISASSRNWIPQTLVISTSLYPPLTAALLEPLEYILEKLSNETLIYNQQLYAVSNNFNCSFWNYSIRTIHSGAWSNQGCRSKSFNSTHIVCQCDHLTNFAVLIRLSERNLSAPIQLSLEIITYVGCGLSVAGLSVTIAVYVFLWKFLKNATHKIHLNLFIWLLLSNLILMFVDLAKNVKPLCAAFACLLHFTLLTTFSWMLIEGIHIYFILVKVFDVREKFRYYHAASIGFSAIVAILTAAITSGVRGVEFYLSSQGCWLSAQNWVILAFIIPFIIIFVANVIFCGLAIHTMLHTKKVAEEAKDLQKARIALRGLIILTPILGLTWSFGCALMVSDSVVLQYLFAITNSIQGVYIFFTHCLLSKKIKEAYNKSKRKGRRFMLSKKKISHKKYNAQESSHSQSRPSFSSCLLSGEQLRDVNTLI
ncbi:uncharacterized protein TRIADDRAFT_55942 [Trichoplax adhaerens]|uniref:Adhesion G protein-coupled receptor L3 n=1 Tax=Trichoplax adhaerens TaxID=10228 RepID=B3RTJ0_TRIAD|nr:predicted protein [Trichoplax adhaerens]EDV25637.1 predicted protein [Trichoplax adhaerens]|eukprot:XP_002111670.1 predicted protein [Trichoplax adhaerens]